MFFTGGEKIPLICFNSCGDDSPESSGRLPELLRQHLGRGEQHVDVESSLASVVFFCGFHTLVSLSDSRVFDVFAEVKQGPPGMHCHMEALVYLRDTKIGSQGGCGRSALHSALSWE